MQFQFSDRRWDIEPSAYVQDQIRLGNWNLSAGLRFDHYGFVVNESAWSPRIGVSRFLPSLNLLVHASYDRVFQTPAMENLLLASSPQLDSVSDVVVRLPVQPARANYYEVGFTKSFAGKLRIDGNVFRRDFHNYSDDDTLLDTGVSFPIAFSSAEIHGEEVQIAVPRWGRFSGFVSYSNQTGLVRGPSPEDYSSAMRHPAYPIRANFPFLRISETPCAPACVFSHREVVARGHCRIWERLARGSEWPSRLQLSF